MAAFSCLSELGEGIDSIIPQMRVSGCLLKGGPCTQLCGLFLPSRAGFSKGYRDRGDQGS